MARFTVLTVALALLTMGCFGELFKPFEPHPANRTDRVGQELAGGVAAMAWSADSREILYVTSEGGSSSKLWAVDVAAGQARQLDTVSAQPPLASIGGTNGPFVYYFRRPPDGDTFSKLVRTSTSGGTPQVVGDSITGYPWRLAVGPDGATVAFATILQTGSPSTMWIRSLGTGGAFRFDSLTPLTFSPGGTALLAAKDNAWFLQYPCSHLVVNVEVATGAIRNLDHGCALLARWEAEGPATISAPGTPPYSRGDTLYLTGPGRGTQPAYAVPYTDALYPHNAAWSPDGQRIAIWYDECSYSIFDFLPSGGPPRVCHKSLYLVDVATGVERWLAGGDGSDDQTAFSPDGRWIAYVLGNVLYLDPVP